MIDQRTPLWDLATRMTDIVEPYSVEVAKWLMERLPDLPRDEQVVKALREHARANAREVLVTLRSGMSPEAHDAPAEAITHAQYLRGRGLGFKTMVDIYQPGYALFRDLAILEFEDSADGPEQVEEMTRALDAYAFPFISATLRRLAIEFGVLETGWEPAAADRVLADREARSVAERIRSDYTARGEWLAETAEASVARRDAEQILDLFAERLEEVARTGDVSDRLAHADTRVEIRLSDEPELAVVLLLDRTPIEVVDQGGDPEAWLSIASVDLARIGSRTFHLPMAIAKGRASSEGPIRKLLRVAPVIQGLFAGTELAGGADHEPPRAEGEEDVAAHPGA